MRLETQKPEFTVDYNPKNKASLKNALKQYAELVESGKAFKNSYCVVVFEPDAESISLSSFKKYPLINSFFTNRNIEP